MNYAYDSGCVSVIALFDVSILLKGENSYDLPRERVPGTGMEM